MRTDVVGSATSKDGILAVPVYLHRKMLGKPKKAGTTQLDQRQLAGIEDDAHTGIVKVEGFIPAAAPSTFTQLQRVIVGHQKSICSACNDILVLEHIDFGDFKVKVGLEHNSHAFVDGSVCEARGIRAKKKPVESFFTMTWLGDTYVNSNLPLYRWRLRQVSNRSTAPQREPTH